MEVAEMEAILQAHNITMPAREVLVDLAEKFSSSSERSGKFVVQMKQVWNWFQNRRYAIRAKTAKSPGRYIAHPVPQSDPAVVKAPAKLSASPMPHSDPAAGRIMPQAPQPIPAPQATVRTIPQVPQPLPAPSVAVQSVGRSASDNTQMEFEAKSARDGAWYDVSSFLSHRSVENGDPEVLVRFAGFGAEEDEWVNVRMHVRQRSLPCESSECVAVLPGDLILCFQEGKEQALYYDAHVLDAQRRRHDVRGCRCRFLVRYDHDQSEEIVPLRKVCRRPETDYRLQQLNAESVKQQKIGNDPTTGNTMKVYPPADTPQKAQTESRMKLAEPTQKQPAPEYTIKPEPNVVPMLQKPSTDSLTGNTLAETTSKLMEEMAEKPVAETAEAPQEEKRETPLAEITNKAPAEAPEQPPAETTPKPPADSTLKPAEATEELPAETTPKPLSASTSKPAEQTEEPPAEKTLKPPAASTSKPDEAPEQPPAETTPELPASSTSNPDEAPKEPPAETTSAEETTLEPPAETTPEPPADTTSKPAKESEEPPAETTLEPPADSTSTPVEEASEEQPKDEEHVDAGAPAASTDQDNAHV
ncbi:hypothetical protein KY290_004687 [Solanum tuberosum]|uniref:Homeobox domain-containing protein n=1 Tax=Solanum tuberosum TaxID=4113 RepID=A0ABQ7WE02_SOLTU|nr:hypothetical protein KY285_006294 [Solanum tuberosum]KAH0778260.1 hypothetical protein KY290_004687 [Solanum tuberosum]